MNVLEKIWHVFAILIALNLTIAFCLFLYRGEYTLANMSLSALILLKLDYVN